MASSLANIQSTVSDLLSPVSTVSSSDRTRFVSTVAITYRRHGHLLSYLDCSSPAFSSLLPTATTNPMTASTTADILTAISSSSSAVPAAQTPTHTDTSLSTPNATSSVADTISPLESTTTVSTQLSQLTQTSLSFNVPSSVTTSCTNVSLPTSSVQSLSG